MAVREASSALTLNTVFGLYRDVWRFALRPVPAPAMLSFGWPFVVALTALFALDATLATGSFLAEIGIANATGHEFPGELENDYSLADDLLTMVILAPLIEEVLFRGWLKGELAALRFAAIAWVSVGLLVLSSLADTALANLTGAAALVLLMMGSAQWAITRERDIHVPAWFEAHFGKFVWGSTLAFGLLHLGNFEEMTSALDLMIVSSQTLGGLILAYTRTRLGLGAAIAQHGAFNCLVLLLAG